MEYLISYNHLSWNWYVGEFYVKFHELLKSKKINVEYQHIHDLARSHGCNPGYTSSNTPSIFNDYNLILTNKKTGKSFIHSWHDYAPAMLCKNGDISKLNVAMFACCSRLTQDIIDNNNQIKIQPSFYILENYDEHTFIEKFKNKEKTINLAYFNGLHYGFRSNVAKFLSNSNKFLIKKKDVDWLPKEKYYEELSNYRMGFNMDGAAMICYRDIECFGLGILLLREKIRNIFYEPLVEDKHYVNLFSGVDMSKILYDESCHGELIKIIDEKVNEALKPEKFNFIINNARSWYEKYCLPENQLNLMYSFLNDLTLLD